MFEQEAEYYAFDEVNHKQEWYIKHSEHSIDCDYEDIKKALGKRCGVRLREVQGRID